ncbi:hypothetical protein ACFX14_013394 [Malus domestica]
MQHAENKVSRNRIRAEEHDSFQRRASKESLSPPRTMCSGSVHSHLGPQGNIFSCLNVQRSFSTRLTSQCAYKVGFTLRRALKTFRQKRPYEARLTRISSCEATE